MKYRIFLFVTLSLLLSKTAMAAPWFGQSDLQATLSSEALVIDHYELSKDELDQFYKSRDYKPAWNFSGAENAKAFDAFLASLHQLISYHGLHTDDYPFALMQSLAASNDPKAQNQLELVVTDTLLLLSHELHGDTLSLDDLYPGWNFHRKDDDIAADLAAAVVSNSLNTYIDSLVPKQPAYRQLANALQIYRTLAAGGGWNKIDPGPSIHPQDHNHRIQQLRLRLAAEGYTTTQNPDDNKSQNYDSDLLKSVVEYQRRNGFDQDGNIGPRTLASLNMPIQIKINQIIANMERWRHMPDNFPSTRYAVVNIPTATLDIFEDRQTRYHGVVIVGRVDRKTPFIQSSIRSMIINPFWHVPTKIAQKDILPKLKKDPHYLEKLGFVISGSEGDPHGNWIDWKSIKEHEFDFRLRQSPGDLNSLGRLKFDFDNDFSVYMHGTPHQELFQKNDRNLSSGCVRLRDPEQVAEILLSSNKGEWNIPHIEEEIRSNKTRWIGLTQPMPLYFVYWTVFLDETGNINFRNDVYDYDSFLIDTRDDNKSDDISKKLNN